MKLTDTKKRLKAIRKNHINKNKEKEGILCVAGEFIQYRVYFRPFMHATATCMKKSFSKMVKFFLFFVCFYAFLSFFSLVLPFS